MKQRKENAKDTSGCVEPRAATAELGGQGERGRASRREKAGTGAGGNSGRDRVWLYLQPFTSLLHRLVQAPVHGVRAGMGRWQQGSAPELRHLLKKIPFPEKKCSGRKRGAPLAPEQCGLRAPTPTQVKIHV